MPAQTAKTSDTLTGFPTWVKITPISLSFSRPPKFKEWEQSIPLFAGLRGALPFWIGDFVNLGEAAFKDQYSQALDLFGQYEYHTIANYASVTRRVNTADRVEGLSFSHHAVVAKCEPADQRRWLKRALYDPKEGRMLTVDELDDLVNPDQEHEGGEAEEGDPEERMGYDKLGEKILKLLVYMGNKAPSGIEVIMLKDAIGKVRAALGKEVEDIEKVKA